MAASPELIGRYKPVIAAVSGRGRTARTERRRSSRVLGAQLQIRAAVTESKGAPFAIQEIELGELRADEVLVEVGAAGICHTDLIVRDQWLASPLPAVLGHEGAGVVVSTGPAVSKVGPGDHVAMSYGTCGSCLSCQRGRPWVCHDFGGRNFGGTRPDGSSALARGGQPIHSHFFSQSSFATHAVATERNLTKLEPSIPPRDRGSVRLWDPDWRRCRAQRAATGNGSQHRGVRHRRRWAGECHGRARCRLHADHRR